MNEQQLYITESYKKALDKINEKIIVEKLCYVDWDESTDEYKDSLARVLELEKEKLGIMQSLLAHYEDIIINKENK